MNLDFFKGKRVFVTGHSGFKGSWLCTLLLTAGAEVTGFSLPPVGEESLYTICGLDRRMHSAWGDIRDFSSLKTVFDEARPEIVFHLAAQPIVRESYRDPVGTYHTNVMGTVHLLECVRQSSSVYSVLNVTTDKVYQNKQWPYGYRETDMLDGFDPYSNSKSCSELLTSSYRNSFFVNGPAVSTARAGNVIGGGDFAKDRIIPDCVRAVISGESIKIRNPWSIRPYQHILEPLSAYLLIVQKQYEDSRLSGCYNVGPESSDCVTTGQLADIFCKVWGAEAKWEYTGDHGPHESAVLKLDCAKINTMLGWKPRWNVERAVKETVDWTKEWLSGGEILRCMERQIAGFLK